MELVEILERHEANTGVEMAIRRGTMYEMMLIGGWRVGGG